jgi:hypothetical protein
VLVRLRLKEIGLEVPHLVIAVTPDGEVVLRGNARTLYGHSVKTGRTSPTNSLHRRSPARPNTDQAPT